MLQHIVEPRPPSKLLSLHCLSQHHPTIGALHLSHLHAQQLKFAAQGTAEGPESVGKRRGDAVTGLLADQWCAWVVDKANFIFRIL